MKLETAKKNLVFHFGVERHASFPKKPVVKEFDMGERKNTTRGEMGTEFADFVTTSFMDDPY